MYMVVRTPEGVDRHSKFRKGNDGSGERSESIGGTSLAPYW